MLSYCLPNLVEYRTPPPPRLQHASELLLGMMMRLDQPILLPNARAGRAMHTFSTASRSAAGIKFELVCKLVSFCFAARTWHVSGLAVGSPFYCLIHMHAAAKSTHLRLQLCQSLDRFLQAQAHLQRLELCMT